jgi:hypothetical protein
VCLVQRTKPLIEDARSIAATGGKADMARTFV